MEVKKPPRRKELFFAEPHDTLHLSLSDPAAVERIIDPSNKTHTLIIHTMGTVKVDVIPHGRTKLRLEAWKMVRDRPSNEEVSE